MARLWYRHYCQMTIRQSTQASYENLIYKHIIPQIGSIKLNKLTQNTCNSSMQTQRKAARKIDSGIAKNDGVSTEDKLTPDQGTNEPCKPKFEAVQGKMRRAGTGCITKINDNLYEGRYSPRGADGKRISKKYLCQNERGM